MNDYPSYETLEKIRTWPYGDYPALVEYLEKAFSPYGNVAAKDGLVVITTGGWSGNDEIIRALIGNHIFWSICWQSSNRGGKFIFQLP